MNKVHFQDEDRRKTICGRTTKEFGFTPRTAREVTDVVDKVTCINCIKKLIHKPPFVCPKGWQLFSDGKWHSPKETEK